MNGTTLRFATAVACAAALAAPASALAAKHHTAHRTAKAPAQTITVVVPHDFDAGGNGAPLVPGMAVRLFDALQLARSLGNNVLGQIGLPPLPTV